MLPWFCQGVAFISFMPLMLKKERDANMRGMLLFQVLKSL